jgi:hypothetical protein
MRRLTFVIALLAALTVTVAASADVPAPAVKACQAEYAQLGADAFVAKYGPTEPWGHCYAQHTDTTTPAPPTEPTTATTTPPTPDSPAVAACKAEYLKLGADAFAARYGSPETFGACVKAHTPAPTTTAPTTTPDSPAVAACKAEYVKLGADAFAAKYGGKEALGQCVRLHTTPTPPTTGDAATSVATAFCQALAKTLGKTLFLAKYGPKEAMGTCVKMSLANAKSLVASCRASSGMSKDAFRACLAAGLQPRR